MRKSATLLILAQLINTSVKLILFVLLTQIGGFEVAGAYTLALAVVTPTFILFGLSLRPIFVTFRGRVDYRSFLMMRFLYGFGGVAIVSLIGVWFHPEHTELLVAMAVYRFTELLVDIRIALLQRSDRISLMALTTVIFALATTAVLATIFLLTANLVLGVWIAGLMGTFVFITISFLGPLGMPKERTTGPWLPKFQEFMSISRSGFMLSASGFAVSMGTSVPVLLIGAFHSPAQVGVYSAIYNITAVTNIFYSSITQAELKRFSDLAAKKTFPLFLRKGKKLSWLMFSLGFSGSIVLYFIGPAVFSFVFGQDFSAELAPIMVMAATISIAPFGFILDAQLTALHKFSVQGILSVVTLALSIIVGLILVPEFGVLGGTLAVFLIMLVRNIAKLAIVKKSTTGVC